MGILNDFERRLEGAIEGIFTKAFRTGVQPVELARRILREMEGQKTVGVHEVWVPNFFEIRLSEADRAKFSLTERALRKELERVVTDRAAERGWGLVGPPEVVFHTDHSLREGTFACEGALVEGPASAGVPAPVPASAPDDAAARPAAGAVAAPDPAVAPREPPGPEPAKTPVRQAELVVVDRGQPVKAFPLTQDRVVIGRLAESDVVLSDPGASRRHAEVRRQDGDYVISDLGSTNGTMVNESAIGERTLEEGDRITIGRTILEFRRR